MNQPRTQEVNNHDAQQPIYTMLEVASCCHEIYVPYKKLPAYATNYCHGRHRLPFWDESSIDSRKTLKTARSSRCDALINDRFSRTWLPIEYHSADAISCRY
jgi:hypothetical protein